MNEIEAYESILGQKLSLKKLYKSPFRNEKNASLSFYRSKFGHIRWTDFGSGQASGNIYDFVGMHIGSQNIENIKAYLHGAKFYDNRNPKVEKLDPPKRLTLEIKTKRWEQHELEYWAQFGIDRQMLSKYNVYPIKHYYINDIKYTNDGDLMFAELVNLHVKIYRPKTPNKKWKSNTTKTDIFGEEQLEYKSKTLVITKSLKDVMVLKAMGIEAISPQSETSGLPASIEKITSKYENVYVLFDNDETGLTRGEEIAKELHATQIYIPKEIGSKDISDLVRDKGVDFAKQTINKLMRLGI